MKKLLLFVLPLTVLLLAARTSDPLENDTLVITFKNVVKGEPLILDSKEYKNEHGDVYKVAVFKYYVSNFKLYKSDGQAITLPQSYFLIDAADKASQTIIPGTIPAGRYSKMSFVIGVDSLHNVSGAQTGALDPANGMFWTWNSGYVFVKLMGTSPQAKEGKIGFDIGGIKPASYSIREQEIVFPGEGLFIKGNKKIQLQTDVATLFKGKQVIDFAAMNKVMGGPKSIIIADNYAGKLFSLISVSSK
jgi:hypothetical protein